MPLEPRPLQAFLAIVEAGSLGRAAASLHLTQPALSRIIKRLEGEVGVALFERRPGGMELTPFGETLRPHAERMLREARLALEEIDLRRGLGRGALRIGAVASAAVMVLPGVLQLLLQRWPGLQVDVTEAVEDRLAEALAAGEVDVVLSGPIAEDEEIMTVADHRYSDQIRVLAAADHPLCRRGRLALADVLEQPWVMPPADAEPRRRFDALVAALGGTRVRVPIETRSPTVIKAVVAQGRALGWLPEPLYAAERAANLLRTLPVGELDQPRHFHVYRRRRQFVAPPVAACLAALRQ
ncbi:MAG: LysR family transcriptional regulator [Steroidobacteraceae bacterium]